MLEPLSNTQTYLVTLSQIYEKKYEIWNPESNKKETGNFAIALEKTIQYAKSFKQIIESSVNKFANLARNEINQRLNDENQEEGQQLQLIYKENVEFFERLTKKFKSDIEKFREALERAKLSEEKLLLILDEQHQVNDFENILLKILQLKRQLLAIVDDENIKNPLRDAYNWFGQHMVREGISPGKLKYSLFSFTGTDAPHQKIPRKMDPLVTEIIRAGNDPIEKAKAYRKMSATLLQWAEELERQK